MESLKTRAWVRLSCMSLLLSVLLTPSKATGQPCELHTYTQTLGVADNFASSNGPEVSAPRPMLAAACQGYFTAPQPPFFLQYDQIPGTPGVNVNQIFAESFTGIPTGKTVVFATLKMKLSAGQGMSETDRVWVGLATADPNSIGQMKSESPGRFADPQITPWVQGTTATIEINLQSFPGGPGVGGVDLTPIFNTSGMLDVIVSDDTAVDSMTLTIQYYDGPAPVVIITPTTIGPTDTSLENRCVTVRGTTLTINGRHSLQSLKIESMGLTPGVVTHSSAFSHAYGPTDVVQGIELSVADTLSIDTGSRIDVTGRGFGPGEGPGTGNTGGQTTQGGAGGGYGGTGGLSPNGTPGGGIYGSITQPADLGSGGGTSFVGQTGTRGGGAVRMVVGGTLSLHGEVIANGENRSCEHNQNSGGPGSGGSVWISAGAVVGNGNVQANGGIACTSGGGGRVAVYGDLAGFSGTMSAYGGGPGTVYRSPIGLHPQLIFDNNGVAGTTLMTHLATPAGADLVIRNGSILSHPSASASGLTIVADNLTIGTNGRIDVTGRGFGPGEGPGAGNMGDQTTQGGSGGGYGGTGGLSPNGAPGGTTYGSITQPIDLGSGGGTSFVGQIGTRGGGAVRLEVAGTVTVMGGIVANGENLSCEHNQNNGGPGSGGSIWITAGVVTGSGVIQANGGVGCTGGGGGRVAIYGDLAAFSGAIRSNGPGAATGASTGGPGTVYRAQSGLRPQLIYDNNGVTATTLMSSLMTPTGADLVVRNGSVLSHPNESAAGLTIVADNLEISASSRIDVSSRGYGPGQGPGAGNTGDQATQGGSGGGYGGAGGPSPNGTPGGATYGSITQPTDLGSGGGTSFVGQTGTRGGGAVRLVIAGTITVMGGIIANGENLNCEHNQNNGGPGSGGSIWITAASVAGSGSVQANGGIGCSGGGGGRVAVDVCFVQLPLSNIAAAGYASAQSGTVHVNPTATSVTRLVTAGAPAGCPGSSIRLSATTVGGAQFLWRRNGTPIVDGPGLNGTVFSGASTVSLLISNISAGDGAATYSVSCTNACGPVVSAGIRAICAADFNCSGGVTIDDLFLYLNAWFTSAPSADINEHSGVSIDDLFYFINAWFSGC